MGSFWDFRPPLQHTWSNQAPLFVICWSACHCLCWEKIFSLCLTVELTTLVRQSSVCTFCCLMTSLIIYLFPSSVHCHFLGERKLWESGGGEFVLFMCNWSSGLINRLSSPKDLANSGFVSLSRFDELLLFRSTVNKITESGLLRPSFWIWPTSMVMTSWLQNKTEAWVWPLMTRIAWSHTINSRPFWNMVWPGFTK